MVFIFHSQYYKLTIHITQTALNCLLSRWLSEDNNFRQDDDEGDDGYDDSQNRQWVEVSIEDSENDEVCMHLKDPIGAGEMTQQLAFYAAQS